MDYFKYFPRSIYVFGNEADDIGGVDRTTTVFQDISVYTDIIDQVKDNAAFYMKYYIQEGERPDVTSQYLYGNPTYHWTFFSMNDSLKTQGWPSSNLELERLVKRDFPHITMTTDEDLTNHFFPGQLVVGQNSGARASVVRRRLDYGQIIVKMITTNIPFTATEPVASKSVDALLTEYIRPSISNEYDATHHFEDGDGNFIDVDPHLPAPAFANPVTFRDQYYRENEELRSINVIKPSLINEVVNLYREALAQ